MSDHLPPELSAAIPPPPAAAPPAPTPTLAHVWTKLGVVEQQLARLVEALVGDVVKGDGGALGRLRALEGGQEDLDERVTVLEQQRERTQEKGLDRAWAIAVDVAKMTGAALLGALAATKGGPHG